MLHTDIPHENPLFGSADSAARETSISDGAVYIHLVYL
jgi:hypothetical protein